MQRGACDYVAKPLDLDEFVLLAERALAGRRLTQELRQLKSGLQEVWEFGALIGRHPRMQEVYKTIGRIASSDVTVLLRGESGTGKELVARAIHHYSRRAGRPFVAVSCAAIPATLLERSEEHTSELQSQSNLVCRLLLEKKKKINNKFNTDRAEET